MQRGWLGAKAASPTQDDSELGCVSDASVRCGSAGTRRRGHAGCNTQQQRQHSAPPHGGNLPRHVAGFCTCRRSCAVYPKKVGKILIPQLAVGICRNKPKKSGRHHRLPSHTRSDRSAVQQRDRQDLAATDAQTPVAQQARFAVVWPLTAPTRCVRPKASRRQTRRTIGRERPPHAERGRIYATVALCKVADTGWLGGQVAGLRHNPSAGNKGDGTWRHNAAQPASLQTPNNTSTASTEESTTGRPVESLSTPLQCDMHRCRPTGGCLTHSPEQSFKPASLHLCSVA